MLTNRVEMLKLVFYLYEEPRKRHSDIHSHTQQFFP